MTSNDYDEIRAYINIVPVIVNAKCDDIEMEKDLLERELKIPFSKIASLEYVATQILPTIKSKEVSMRRRHDEAACPKGVILNEYQAIYCRKYTAEYLIRALLQEYSVVVISGMGGAYSFPFPVPAHYIDQWKGDEIR